MASFVFIVQGEGRGHMSQAMALKQFLDRHHHNLLAVFAGTSPFRKVPEYFLQFFRGKARLFTSPNFITRKNRKGINIFESIVYNLTKILTFRREIKHITNEIIRLNPDFVVNFYDPVGALAIRRIPDRITTVAISHHFYFAHHDFIFPKGFPVQKMLLKVLNRIIRKGCDRVGALSFREGMDEKNLWVIPPLIREEITRLARNPGDRDLVYLLQPGFLNDIIPIARTDPEFRADLFCDTVPDMDIPGNMSVHLPDDQLFLEKMKSCRRLITTSGFDAIAEAGMLSVPVIAVPSENHYEQLCNAEDMQRAGLGIYAGKFSREALKFQIICDNQNYIKWLMKSEGLLLKLFEK